MQIVELNKRNRLNVFYRFADEVESANLLDKIKTLPEGRYQPISNCWDVPNTKFVRSQLELWGFDPPNLQKHEPLIIDDMDERVRDYQVVGVKRTKEFNDRILLGMEMGTGKTCVSLTYARIEKKRPVVVVCPASVKLNWSKEIKKWMNREEVLIVNGRKPQYFGGVSIIIVNYDILEDHVPRLLKTKPQILIIDECQYIKSPKALRSKATKKLAESIPAMLALSGTPILQKPSEFWSVLNMLKPEIWSNKMAFMYRYCAPRRKRGDWVFDGATNMVELNSILNDEVMYRVLKKDVLKELPEKTFTVIPFDIDNQREYKIVEYKLKTTKRWIERVNLAGEIRKTACEGKMKMALDWISDFIEVEKLVVFGIHHIVLDAVMKRFGTKAVRIDGRVPGVKREQLKDKFISDSKVRLLAGNMEALGVGNDGLQHACSNVAIIEFPWIPTWIDQSTDRLHRMGQLNGVMVFYLMAVNTIEERMVDLLDKKRTVVTQCLDGEEPEEGSMIRELLNGYAS